MNVIEAYKMNKNAIQNFMADGFAVPTSKDEALYVIAVDGVVESCVVPYSDSVFRSLGARIKRSPPGSIYEVIRGREVTVM